MKHNPEKLTTVRIEVTDRLVKTGTVNDSQDCPVARALKKVVSKNVEVEADYDDITFATEDGDFQQIATPARVSKFMEKIDARDLDARDYDDDSEIPPLPKAFAFNLKIKNKFLKPSFRA